MNKLFLIKATKAKVIKINHAFLKPKPVLNAPLNHRLIANEISLFHESRMMIFSFCWIITKQPDLKNYYYRSSCLTHFTAFTCDTFTATICRNHPHFPEAELPQQHATSRQLMPNPRFALSGRQGLTLFNYRLSTASNE